MYTLIKFSDKLLKTKVMISLSRVARREKMQVREERLRKMTSEITLEPSPSASSMTMMNFYRSVQSTLIVSICGADLAASW